MDLLCDEMLAGLCRWLRAAGHDTAMMRRGTGDAEVVARAARDGRLLLTRDRRILERRLAAGRTLLLEGDALEGWAAQVTAGLGLDWLAAPFSRCLLCNLPVAPAPAAARARVPAAARGCEPLTACRGCGRLYWPGAHVRRMTARLRRWQAGDFHPGAGAPISTG